MISVHLNIKPGPMTPAKRAAFEELAAWIEAEPRNVIARLKGRVGPFGMFRPSYAFRAEALRAIIRTILDNPPPDGWEDVPYVDAIDVPEE